MLNFIILKNLINNNNDNENLSVEILQDHCHSILVSIIYKPPEERQLNS